MRRDRCAIRSGRRVIGRGRVLGRVGVGAFGNARDRVRGHAIAADRCAAENRAIPDGQGAYLPIHIARQRADSVEADGSQVSSSRLHRLAVDEAGDHFLRCRKRTDASGGDVYLGKKEVAAELISLSASLNYAHIRFDCDIEPKQNYAKPNPLHS